MTTHFISQPIKQTVRSILGLLGLQRQQYPGFEIVPLSKHYHVLRVTSESEFERTLSLLNSDNYRFLRCAQPGHYYSPIPDIKEIQSNSEVLFDRSTEKVSGVDVKDDAQLNLASNFVSFYDDMPFTDKKDDRNRYYLDNSYYSYGDGLVLYSMMRLFKPRRIVEIGSGFSSAAMLDTDEKFLGGQVQFTFIEPYPERLLSLLRNKDVEHCEIIKQPVQMVSVDHFDTLCENDFLFIDSSHVGKICSDVLHNLFILLPSLKKGVIVSWPGFRGHPVKTH